MVCLTRCPEIRTIRSMKRVPIVLPDKICEHCKTAFNRAKRAQGRGSAESQQHYLRRRFCSRSCLIAYLKATRKAKRPRSGSPRASDYTADRKVKNFDYDSYYEQADFRNSKRFIEYRQMLETILKTKRALTIRRIHQLAMRLKVDGWTTEDKEHARRWTYDALETSDQVVILKGFIDHFRYCDEQRPEPKVQLWNSGI